MPDYTEPDDHIEPEDDANETSEDASAPGTVGPITPDVLADMKRWNAEWEEAKATGQQLGLGLESDEPPPIDYNDLSSIKDTQVPDESTELAVLIQNAIVGNLPKGARWAKMREYIYEEKNIYLRRGRKKSEKKRGRIGANSNITYTAMQKRMRDVVLKWAADGAEPIELFYALVKLNQEAGYRPKNYEGPLKIQGALDDVLRAAVRGDREGDTNRTD